MRCCARKNRTRPPCADCALNNTVYMHTVGNFYFVVLVVVGALAAIRNYPRRPEAAEKKVQWPHRSVRLFCTRFHISVAVVCTHKHAQTQYTPKTHKVIPVRRPNQHMSVTPRPTCSPARGARLVLQETREHGHFVPQCARHTHCTARGILRVCAATLYKCFVFCVPPPPSRAVICPGRAAWCTTTWQVLYVRSVAVFCVDVAVRPASDRRFHRQNTASTRFSVSIKWHTHATLDVGVAQDGGILCLCV